MRLRRLTPIVLFFLPVALAAHPGHGESPLLHAASGLDHLAAALAIGIIAARQRLLTGTLLAFCAGWLGGSAMQALFGIGSYELAVLISVLLLGVAAFKAEALNPKLALVLVGFTAVVHGAAHASDTATLSFGRTAAMLLGSVATIAGATWVLGWISRYNQELGLRVSRLSSVAVVCVAVVLLFMNS